MANIIMNFIDANPHIALFIVLAMALAFRGFCEIENDKDTADVLRKLIDELKE